MDDASGNSDATRRALSSASGSAPNTSTHAAPVAFASPPSFSSPALSEGKPQWWMPAEKQVPTVWCSQCIYTVCGSIGVRLLYIHSVWVDRCQVTVFMQCVGR